MKKYNKYVELEMKKNKIEKERNKSLKHIHIGVIIYFIIFTYLLFYVISFIFSKETNYTIAELGNIVDSKMFTGLIIRNELVIKSSTDGKANYFAYEGEKVKKDSLICLVYKDGEISEIIKKNIEETNKLLYDNSDSSDKNNNFIREQLKSYVVEKDKNYFSNVYNVKKNIQNTVSETTKLVILDNRDDFIHLLNTNEVLSEKLKKDSSIYTSPKSGIISYNIDGLEEITIDDFSNEIFQQIDETNEVVNNYEVSKNVPIFKIVDNYKWYIVAEIDDLTKEYLNDKDMVKLYVDDKDIEINVKKLRYINRDDKVYVVFEADRYINDFLSERFIDFTIIFEEAYGIKIPNSAVVEKDFFIVPYDVVTKDGNNYVVYKKIFDDKYVSGETIEKVNLQIIYSKDDKMYIPVNDELKKGDILTYSLSNNNKTFTLSEIEKLNGVYVINEGYVKFKLIETVSIVENYRIVKEKIPFGVRMYDRIITNANVAKENEIIY